MKKGLFRDVNCRVGAVKNAFDVPTPKEKLEEIMAQATKAYEEAKQANKWP